MHVCVLHVCVSLSVCLCLCVSVCVWCGCVAHVCVVCGACVCGAYMDANVCGMDVYGVEQDNIFRFKRKKSWHKNKRYIMVAKAIA